MTPEKVFTHSWLNSEKIWKSLNEMLESNTLLENIDAEQIDLLLKNSLGYIIDKKIFEIRSSESEK